MAYTITQENTSLRIVNEAIGWPVYLISSLAASYAFPEYNKTCLKRPLKKRQTVLNGKW